MYTISLEFSLDLYPDTTLPVADFLEVTVTDVCVFENTIAVTDVVNVSPQTYTMLSSADIELTIPSDPVDAQSTLNDIANICGAFSIELFQRDADDGTLTSLDADPTFALSDVDYTVTVNTVDITKRGTYDLVVKYTLTDYPSVELDYTVATVTLEHGCIDGNTWAYVEDYADETPAIDYPTE